MTQLQNWAVAMCSTGIGCAVLYMLCPSGTMRRVFAVLTAVFFLCCLLSPLKMMVGAVSKLFALPEDITVPTELTDAVNEQTEQLLSDILYEDAVARVGDSATVKKVAVCRDTARTDGIYIERVRVTFAKEDRAAAPTVRVMLEKAWGVTVEVYYVG